MAHYPNAQHNMMMPQSTIPNSVVVVSSQPMSGNVWEFENEWHNDLCNCCEDCGQCKFIINEFFCFKY
jgi:hypothetical protein